MPITLRLNKEGYRGGGGAGLWGGMGGWGAVSGIMEVAVQTSSVWVLNAVFSPLGYVIC